MSRKHFSWLLLLTSVVAALVLLVPAKTGHESSREPGVFLPGASANVNDVDWLRLTAAGGVTIATLKRGESAWVVEEASGYQADWGRIKALLAGLSQAQVIEAKTANPEYYPRLGVEDVSLPEAGGVMVEFSRDSTLPAVIIGNSAQNREGQYARLQDAADSVLIDRRLDVPTERTAWLDQSVVDISDEEVVEVVITHPDGESIRAVKISADDENFILQDIPDGMEIKSDWSVNALAGAQLALNLEDVGPQDSFDWTNAVRFRLLTADGLLVESELLAIESDDGAESAQATQQEAPAAESEYWIRLQAQLYTTALESGVETTEADTATRERAETINQRVEGWAYRIPAYKFESMTRRRDDLLRTAE